MPLVTVVFGIVLTAVGVVSYVLSNAVSVTALIPAFIGVVFIILGALALAKPTLRKHVMHAVVVLALVALLGTAGGIPKTISYLRSEVLIEMDQGKVLLSNNEVVRPMAVVAQSIVAILSLIFIAMCVQSFIAARKRRESAPIVG